MPSCLFLVGPHDRHLYRMERRLGVTIALRGNRIAISGAEPGASYALRRLCSIYTLSFLKGFTVDIEEVEAAIRMASAIVSTNKNGDDNLREEISIATKRRMVFPRSKRQIQLYTVYSKQRFGFWYRAGGTGKTYLAVAVGVSLLLSGRVDRIILSRPAVEAERRLGFLPGDLREKVDPYLRPFMTHYKICFPSTNFSAALQRSEVAPLAFMRGRTLSNSFVILDEAQNTTPTQMKMLLTRLGNNSRMVINGDLTQIDLPPGITSGLKRRRSNLTGY